MKAREYFESRNVIKANPFFAMYRTVCFLSIQWWPSLFT